MHWVIITTVVCFQVSRTGANRSDIVTIWDKTVNYRHITFSHSDMMNDLESLRHEAEQLKNAIRVSDKS